jgi:hypothetical protein
MKKEMDYLHMNKIPQKHRKLVPARHNKIFTNLKVEHEHNKNRTEYKDRMFEYVCITVGRYSQYSQITPTERNNKQTKCKHCKHHQIISNPREMDITKYKP